jgi:hypothetical protein
MSQDQKTALWLTPWLAPQRTLPGILRWSRFYDHGNRKQDGLQHAVSITFLGMMVLDRIASFLVVPEGPHYNMSGLLHKEQ